MGLVAAGGAVVGFATGAGAVVGAAAAGAVVGAAAGGAVVGLGAAVGAGAVVGVLQAATSVVTPVRASVTRRNARRLCLAGRPDAKEARSLTDGNLSVRRSH